MSARNVIRLNDGTAVPRLAFGTGEPPDLCFSSEIVTHTTLTAATPFLEKECSAHLLAALQKGFRHIDTAEFYLNEESVGTALDKWEDKREDVSITTK